MGYVIQKYHGKYNTQSRGGTKVRYIVVHYVGAGTSAPGSALANCKYFAGGNRKASAHYFIDDGSTYEYASPSVATWHVGDGHGRYDSNLAIQIGKALEEYDLMFFEEPVQPEDEEGMLRVARSVNIPIAAGERLTRPQEFRRLIEKRAISIAQPDLAHCHGFNEGLKVAHLAEAFDAFVAPHCPMSPVITAISLHLDAIAPNFLIQERLFLNDWRNEVITEPLQVKEGFLDLPQKPGWGIELNEEQQP